MADPVKTSILKAIVAAIEAIPAVGTVKRNPPSPPKRETANFPVVFVYDGTESKRRKNMIAMNILPIQIETYFLSDEEDASDRADQLDCEIFKVLMDTPAIFSLVQDISPDEESSTSKQFVDEFLSAVVSRYVVKYSHAWKDPTNQANP